MPELARAGASVGFRAAAIKPCLCFACRSGRAAGGSRLQTPGLQRSSLHAKSSCLLSPKLHYTATTQAIGASASANRATSLALVGRPIWKGETDCRPRYGPSILWTGKLSSSGSQDLRSNSKHLCYTKPCFCHAKKQPGEVLRSAAAAVPAAAELRSCGPEH